MNRGLPRHCFRQALKAGLPVQRRAASPQDLVLVLTFDAEGNCVSQELRPAFAAGAPQGELMTFSARPRDPDTDLQYHRPRCHDPSPGRWLSEDPAAFAAGDPIPYHYAATGPHAGRPPRARGERTRIGHPSSRWSPWSAFPCHDASTPLT